MKSRLLIILLLLNLYGCKERKDRQQSSHDVAMVEDTVPDGFHKYENHYWVYDDERGELVDNMELYIAENGITGSYASAAYREDLANRRDSLVSATDSLVSCDDIFGVKENLYKIALTYSEILRIFNSSNPVTICHRDTSEYNYKIQRIEYFANTYGDKAFFNDQITRQILEYIVSFSK